jgi:uncharacterized small protein (DUF1192 family)
MNLNDAMEYGRKTAEAKKEIRTLADSDERVRLLYEEILRLNAASNKRLVLR